MEGALGRRSPPGAALEEGAAVLAPVKHFCVLVSENLVSSMQLLEAAVSWESRLVEGQAWLEQE